MLSKNQFKGEGRLFSQPWRSVLNLWLIKRAQIRFHPYRQTLWLGFTFLSNWSTVPSLNLLTDSVSFHQNYQFKQSWTNQEILVRMHSYSVRLQFNELFHLSASSLKVSPIALEKERRRHTSFISQSRHFYLLFLLSSWRLLIWFQSLLIIRVILF